MVKKKRESAGTSPQSLYLLWAAESLHGLDGEVGAELLSPE
jgi:hypothetical protein